jgi:hypothetical protein
MFVHDSWMSIFFKLFNFAALVALIVFIYRRYIYSGVIQGIAEEKQQEEGMQRQVVILDQKGKELTQAAINQEHETRFLLNRALQWQEVFKLEHEKKKHEHKVLCDSARSRKKLQMKTLETEQMRAIVVPESLEKAHGTLVETFADKKRGREYLEALLTTLKQSL